MNNMYKALSAGLVSVVLLAGCASAKTAPADAAAEPAPAAEETTTVAAAPEEVTASADDMHVVVSGEHLWGISSYSQIYNDPYQWPLIYRHNRDQITDADLIYPGQELAIKRDFNDEQVQQAIMHAKTRGAWTLGVTEDNDLDYLFEAY